MYTMTTSVSVSRRRLLRLTAAGGVGLLALGLTGCAPTAPSVVNPVATNAPTPAPAPTTAQTAPGQAGTSASWNQLVESAAKEGKVVVSGPPTDDARKN